MPWIFGIIGLAVGGIIAYLTAERRGRAQVQEVTTARSVAEQRLADLAPRLENLIIESRQAGEKCSQAEQRCAAMTAQLRAAEQNFTEQKKMLDDAQAKLREAFAGVSAEALAKNNEAFLQLARERFAALSTEANGSLDKRKVEIEGLLKPLNETMIQYQQRLADIEKARVESYSQLREQLGALQETERTLNLNTTQLVSALRRPNTRGQWGEMTLRRLVELAGMTSRCDFFEQATVQGEDGKLRPDMMIRLPGGHEIVVDCKTTLDAFLDAAAANDEDNRKVLLQQHSRAVRARARELCSKNYSAQFENADFVVMFLPGESFYSAAVEADASLYEDCLKSHVIVATPTTLLALLKTVAHVWKQHDMTENAEKIQELGTELYDRLAIMANHFQKLGNAIGSVVDQYNTAIGSVESRVMVSARKMGELGTRNEKELPVLNQVERRVREIEIS
ncbi:MAG TPA: DNA recombination protein RmuC [Tepidisphaeraceae bacterium]|jgi:DNA recombination protein RmuC